MSQTTKQFKGQLPKNALMALLSFVSYALSAVWLTPYLVNHLGAAAYGLVPIAELFTQYVSIITANLSGAVNRFLVVELQKKNGSPNVIFNSSLSLYVALVLIQIPIFYFGIRYADRLFTIPSELRTDALLLLGWSAGGFLLSLISGVFGVSLYSKNRLDISSTIHLARLLLRLALIVVLFSVWGPKLRYIGYIDFMLNVLMTMCSIYYWRKFTPELFISPRQVDWKILSPVFGMSVWTIINQLGALLYLRSDIWIINRFISPVIAGQYAAILVAANFIRQLGLLFSGQFGPVSMSYWAKGEMIEMRRLLVLSVKVLSVGLALPAAFMCIYGDRVLGLWLGPDFAKFSLLLVVLCIHLPINASVFPLFQLQTASNSVQVPALVTFTMGIVNVAVSYWLGVRLGMGALGVALATAMVLVLKNTLFTPLYGAYILEIPAFTFIKPLFSGILMMGVVWVVALVPFDRLFNWVDSGLLLLLLEGGCVSLLAGGVGFFVLISTTERRVLINMLPEKIKRCARTRYGEL